MSSQTTAKVGTDYLRDPYNHTGYAQVLEETTGSTTITYTIGDDVIAQYNSTDGTEYLLYDGHGSTRQLADDTGAIVTDQNFSYDAYGVMLGNAANPESGAGTKMLYAGEQYDPDFSGYYNRARYYNQSNGRFNRTDPYAGSPQDPQSLHKYLYVHGNPVNGIDPTGKFSIVEVSVNMAISAAISRIIMPVIAPMASTLAERFLPPKFKAIFDKIVNDFGVLMVGGGFSGTFGFGYAGIGAGLGVVGGLEGLLSPRTYNGALYTYDGWTAGFQTQTGANFGFSLYSGLVYGVRNSLDYTGPFNSITVPLKYLKPSRFKRLEESYLQGLASFNASPTDDFASYMVIEGLGNLAKAFSLKSNTILTLFTDEVDSTLKCNKC